jgi:hypothetical protein
MTWHHPFTGTPTDVADALQENPAIPLSIRSALRLLLTIFETDTRLSGETHGYLDRGRGTIVIVLETKGKATGARSEP